MSEWGQPLAGLPSPGATGRILMSIDGAWQSRPYPASTVTWSPAGGGGLTTWTQVYAAITEARLADRALTVVLDRQTVDDPEMRIPAGEWLLGEVFVTSKRYGNLGVNELIIEDGAVLVDPGGAFKSVFVNSQSSSPILAFTDANSSNPVIIALDLGSAGVNNGTAPCYICPDNDFCVFAILGGGVQPGNNGAPIVALGSGSTCQLVLVNGAQTIDPGAITGPADSTLLIAHDGAAKFPLVFPGMLGTIVNIAYGVSGGAGPTSFRPYQPSVGCTYYDTDVGAHITWDGATWRVTTLVTTKEWTIDDFGSGAEVVIPLEGLGRCIPLMVSVRSATGIASGDAGTTGVGMTIGTVAVLGGITTVAEILGAPGDRPAPSMGPFGICMQVTDIGDLKATLTATGGTPDCANVSGDMIITLYYMLAP